MIIVSNSTLSPAFGAYPDTRAALDALAAAERAVTRDRRGADTGERSQSIVQPAVQQGDVGGLVAGQPRVEAGEQDVIRLEAERPALEIQQTARQQVRAHEQHQRDGDLRDDEHARQAQRSTAADRPAAADFQRRHQIGAPGRDCGREAEQQAGKARERHA